MKKIFLITTGGTIASRQTSDGLAPSVTSDEILEYIPEVDEICSITTYGLFNLDSTNVCYQHWISMVKCLKEHYSSYDGFVITHGTDTMAYTAAALSYMVQNSMKPIVITGSQRPLASVDSDARSNLLNDGSDLLAEGLGTVQIEGAIPIGSEAAVPLIGIVDGNIVLFRLIFVQATRFMDAVFDPILLAIEQLAITAELDFLLLSHDCLPPSP